MEGEYQSCKKAMQQLKYQYVNCGTCRHKHKCLTEEEYMSIPAFVLWDKQMKSNKGVHLG